MEAFILFIQKYEIWIYVLFGAVALIYFRKLFLSMRERRGSLFGLERENAQRKISFALTIVGLLGIMALVLFIVNTFVVPSLPGLKSLQTPTINVLATATITLAASPPTSGTPFTNSTGTPAAHQPTATLTAEGCIPNQLEWVSPQPGEEIYGSVDLKGTVSIADLGFYKYEYAPTGSDKWLTIAAGNTKVVNDLLGQWNTSQVVPGDYMLRLVVSDNTNKLMPACIVKVKITQPK